MRELKFRAWIPSLEIMLEEITLYPYGDIGIESDELSKKLAEKDSRLSIDWDSECIRLIDEDNDLFENVLEVMTGDDWIQINSNDCIIMQYVGLFDKNKNDIIEGDVLENPIRLKGHVVYFEGAFYWKYINKEGTQLMAALNNGLLKNKEKTGNIYENKN